MPRKHLTGSLDNQQVAGPLQVFKQNKPLYSLNHFIPGLFFFQSSPFTMQVVKLSDGRVCQLKLPAHIADSALCSFASFSLLCVFTVENTVHFYKVSMDLGCASLVKQARLARAGRRCFDTVQKVSEEWVLVKSADRIWSVFLDCAGEEFRLNIITKFISELVEPEEPELSGQQAGTARIARLCPVHGQKNVAIALVVDREMAYAVSLSLAVGVPRREVSLTVGEERVVELDGEALDTEEELLFVRDARLADFRQFHLGRAGSLAVAVYCREKQGQFMFFALDEDNIPFAGGVAVSVAPQAQLQFFENLIVLWGSEIVIVKVHLDRDRAGPQKKWVSVVKRLPVSRVRQKHGGEKETPVWGEVVAYCREREEVTLLIRDKEAAWVTNVQLLPQAPQIPAPALATAPETPTPAEEVSFGRKNDLFQRMKKSIEKKKRDSTPRSSAPAPAPAAEKKRTSASPNPPAENGTTLELIFSRLNSLEQKLDRVLQMKKESN